MKPSRTMALVVIGLLLGLVIGYAVGWHYGFRNLKFRRQEALEGFQRVMIASQIYQMAYSNNPAGVEELLRTNESTFKP
jgi:hypothetical protein